MMRHGFKRRKWGFAFYRNRIRERCRPPKSTLPSSNSLDNFAQKPLFCILFLMRTV